MNNVSKERFNEILREEITRTRQNEMFFDVLIKLEGCKNNREIQTVLSEGSIDEGFIKDIWSMLVDGDGEGSGVFDTWKQSFIEWVIGFFVDSPTMQKLVGNILQNFSIPQLIQLARDPNCDDLMEVAIVVSTETIAEEFLAALQNAADDAPLLHYLVGESGYDSVGSALSTTMFGAAGENLGDAIRQSELFTSMIHPELAKMCDNVTNRISGFSIGSMFSNQFS